MAMESHIGSAISWRDEQEVGFSYYHHSICLIPNYICQKPAKERDAPTLLEQSGENREKGGAYSMFLPTGGIPLGT